MWMNAKNGNWRKQAREHIIMSKLSCLSLFVFGLTSSSTMSRQVECFATCVRGKIVIERVKYGI